VKSVTCYFRHLNSVFAQAGIEVTRENKKELGGIMQQITCEIDCPAVWRQIKKRLAEDEAGFIAELRLAWVNRSVKV
jgi:hypothetical protein